MKHLITLLIAASIGLFAEAQPTLTLATNAPTAGTGYTLNYGAWASAGPGGTNFTWDLSTLTADSSLSVQYAAVAGTPNGAQFPTATVAEVNDVVTQYYRVAADGIHFAGSDDGESIIVHNPQGIYLPFPCTIGDNWSSPQNATFTSEGMTVTRTGNFSGGADGYGTLVMPSGSIPNVLRVHWTHTLEDVMGPMTMVHTYDSYVFFVAGQAQPIVELVTASIDFGGGTQTRQFSRWTNAVSTHIDDRATDALGLFPNPADEEVTISWPAELGTPATVAVVNMAGRTVMHEHLPATSSTSTRIHVGSLFAGLYHVTLTSSNGRRTTATLCVR